MDFFLLHVCPDCFRFSNDLSTIKWLPLMTENDVSIRYAVVIAVLLYCDDYY